MSYGSNYIQVPYEAVSANAVSTYEHTIPSGASIVRGIYYMWSDSGFINKGWMTSVSGSPTQMAIEAGIISTDGYNDDEAAVAGYVAENQNLDRVFSYWAQHYTLEGWDNFYMAVGVDSGCMDVDHSQI